MARSYSVVIPAFNAELTLAAAIDSVLSQTAPPSAVIVIDDGSTDRTAAIARAYGPPVTVIQQANSGPGAATTMGFELATTPIIACLDADDIWLVDKASRQLDQLALRPELDAVFGRMKLFRHDQPPQSDATVRDGWLRSTMMIGRSAARQIGPMVDFPNKVGDVIDWLTRGREMNMNFEMMPDVVALRRITPGSLSTCRETRGQGYLQAVRAALDRRRKKPS
jgi:glycosyltransferase involved in cell wall biosynthesis